MLRKISSAAIRRYSRARKQFFAAELIDELLFLRSAYTIRVSDIDTENDQVDLFVDYSPGVATWLERVAYAAGSSWEVMARSRAGSKRHGDLAGWTSVYADLIDDLRGEGYDCDLSNYSGSPGGPVARMEPRAVLCEACEEIAWPRLHNFIRERMARSRREPLFPCLPQPAVVARLTVTLRSRLPALLSARTRATMAARRATRQGGSCAA